MSATTPERTGVTTQAIEGSQTIRLAPNYWPFVVPALVVVGAVIVFPWAFTLWMSVNRWTLGQARSWTDHLLWHHAAHTVDLFAYQTGGSIVQAQAIHLEPVQRGIRYGAVHRGGPCDRGEVAHPPKQPARDARRGSGWPRRLD